MFLRGLLLAVCIAAGTAHGQTLVERMLIAAQDNDVAAVAGILRSGMPVDTVDPAGNSLLMIAGRHGRIEMARLLLDLKANVRHRNSVGDTPLMFASIGGIVEVARLLVERRAEVNHPGWTALHYCAASGKAAMCQFLLDRDADIDARSPNGTTPLMMGVKEGHFDAVKLLVWEVADVNARNDDGATALMWALRAERADMVGLLKQAGAKE